MRGSGYIGCTFSFSSSCTENLKEEEGMDEEEEGSEEKAIEKEYHMPGNFCSVIFLQITSK